MYIIQSQNKQGRAYFRELNYVTWLKSKRESPFCQLEQTWGNRDDTNV
jgi:hypothetical protein